MKNAQSGQTATEYVLLISVVVIGVAAAAYVFVPRFELGVNALAADVSTIVDSGQIGGVGTARGNACAGSGCETTASTGSGIHDDR